MHFLQTRDEGDVVTRFLGRGDAVYPVEVRCKHVACYLFWGRFVGEAAVLGSIVAPAVEGRVRVDKRDAAGGKPLQHLEVIAVVDGVFFHGRYLSWATMLRP